MSRRRSSPGQIPVDSEQPAAGAHRNTAPAARTLRPWSATAQDLPAIPDRISPADRPDRFAPAGSDDILPAQPPRGRGRFGGLGRLAGRAAAVLGVVLFLSVTVGPRVSPFRALVVRSGSMAPAIPTGSVIVVEQVRADTLAVGDVITVDVAGDRRVTHRVVAQQAGDGGRVLVTKGDANQVPDAWRVAATGQGYKVVGSIPGVGLVAGRLQGPLWRTALISVPALLLGLIVLRDIWSPSRDFG